MTTRITENARLELLRLYALLDDMGRDKGPHWPTHSPLFECEADEGPCTGWENDREDIILALEECVKLGHMEATALHTLDDPIARIHANLRGGREWVARITPDGYAWIRAHDAIGEAMQERAS